MSENSPDYSAIDSRVKAEEPVSEGLLVKMLLLPLEFGGNDIAENCVYVPPFVLEIKQGADRNIIAPLVENGHVSRYRATPKYQGASFVPCAVEIQGFDPGDFRETICIWGDGMSFTNAGAA